MTSMITKAKVFLLDLGDRAGKSFVQGAGVVLVARWTDLTDAVGAHNWSAVETVGAAVVGGGLVAVGSVITSLLSRLRTGTASASKAVATTAVVPAGASPTVIEQAPAPVPGPDNDGPKAAF